jgi:hypothetical protein
MRCDTKSMTTTSKDAASKTTADAYVFGYAAALDDIRVMILDGMTLNQIFSHVGGDPARMA